MNTNDFLLFLSILMFTVLCVHLNQKTAGPVRLITWIFILIGLGVMIGQIAAFMILPIIVSVVF